MIIEIIFTQYPRSLVAYHVSYLYELLLLYRRPSTVVQCHIFEMKIMYGCMNPASFKNNGDQIFLQKSSIAWENDNIIWAFIFQGTHSVKDGSIHV